VLTRHALIQPAGPTRAGVRVTTHQISAVDARLGGFQAHSRADGTPLALKLGPGQDKESRPDDSASVFDDELQASADKVVSPTYPPQPQTRIWR
jgi:hypothetical protein